MRVFTSKILFLVSPNEIFLLELFLQDSIRKESKKTIILKGIFISFYRV